MQIVINVSEEMYNFACNYPEKILAGYSLCIKNGTPLPKGHGRLIDADALECDYFNRISDDYAFDCIDNAPTIIPADKEK